MKITTLRDKKTKVDLTTPEGCYLYLDDYLASEGAYPMFLKRLKHSMQRHNAQSSSPPHDLSCHSRFNRSPSPLTSTP